MCQGGFVPHRNYQESGRVSAKARGRVGAWARGACSGPRIEQITIEPVLSSKVLNGHPVLSGRLSKTRICFPLITVIFTSLSGHLS